MTQFIPRLFILASWEETPAYVTQPRYNWQLVPVVALSSYDSRKKPKDYSRRSRVNGYGNVKLTLFTPAILDYYAAYISMYWVVKLYPGLRDFFILCFFFFLHILFHCSAFFAALPLVFDDFFNFQPSFKFCFLGVPIFDVDYFLANPHSKCESSIPQFLFSKSILKRPQIKPVVSFSVWFSGKC